MFRPNFWNFYIETPYSNAYGFFVSVQFIILDKMIFDQMNWTCEKIFCQHILSEYYLHIYSFVSFNPVFVRTDEAKRVFYSPCVSVYVKMSGCVSVDIHLRSKILTEKPIFILGPKLFNNQRQNLIEFYLHNRTNVGYSIGTFSVLIGFCAQKYIW